MNFTIYRIPRIKSFNDAELILDTFDKNYEGRARPKKWPVGVAPLHSLRNDHYFLGCPNPEEIHCTLYDTPLVTYYRDGSVRISPHPSDTSMRFYERVSPPGLEVIRKNGGLYVKMNGRDIVALMRSSTFEYQAGWTTKFGSDRMKIATLQYRKIPTIKKKLQPVKDWISIKKQLAGEGRLEPVEPVEPITAISAEEMKMVLNDRTQWARFAHMREVDVLEFVCRSLDILTFRTVSKLPSIPRAPNRTWRRQFPSLITAHGIEFV